GTPINAQILQQLQDAGIPMRKRVADGILHWKMMLFAGQDVVEFSGANYSAFALTPVEPYDSYIDEAIAFVDDPSVTNSFRTKYDDLWTDTTDYADYANISGPLTRTYPTFTKDPELNWPPQESYRSRSVKHYNAETVGIDIDMYRITDRAHTDAIIKAVERGVPVRLYTEQREYRNPARPWVAWNVDRLYAAGVQVRIRGHQGLNHQKAVILKGQRMVIFGSSNWSSPSSDAQQEHNYFTTKPYFFDWFTDQFERKWNNSTGHIETAPFTPLPPDTPQNRQPANGATDRLTTNRQLTWYAGLWAHVYDIYFGTSPTPPLLAANLELGPSFSSSDVKKFLLPSPLQPGTTYYWRIVSKTMAGLQRSGPVWHFTTAGPAPGGSLPSGWSSADIGDTGVQGSSTYIDPTFTVRGGGADVWGTADALQFAFRSLSGDGTITARVATVQNVAAWTKAGVMIRASLSPSSQQAFMLVSPGKGVAFQRRRTSGGTSVHTAGSASTAPRWVRLTRSGGTITAFESSNGSTWTQVGSDNIAMPETIFVGLGVSSHVRGSLAQATFDSVSVTVAAGQSLPGGWTDRDIGSVPIVGSASYANGTYTVTGSGADIWGTADAFHYAYQTLSGDGSITARVVSVEFADRWSKGGVMIRAGTGASAAHAFMLVSAGKGVAFQRRPVAGGESLNTAGTLSSPPRWVRLTRTGSTFRAYESADGANWTLVGSQTISMPSTVEIGLAVTSHTTSSDTTARFDNVVIDGGSAT
ncbi:MAG TPA: phospholipase D-like domain-containing protein, partial [Gemmatimonadaceae bacterium]